MMPPVGWVQPTRMPHPNKSATPLPLVGRVGEGGKPAPARSSNVGWVKPPWMSNVSETQTKTRRGFHPPYGLLRAGGTDCGITVKGYFAMTLMDAT